MTSDKLIMFAILAALTVASFAPIVPRYTLIIRRDMLTGWAIRIERRRG